MINFDLLADYLEHDPDIIQAVLMAYLEDHQNFNAEFIKQIEAQDWSALEINAHTLKGVLASFGETVITPLLERVELNSKQQQLPTCEEVALITATVTKINQQIEEYIN